MANFPYLDMRVNDGNDYQIGLTVEMSADSGVNIEWNAADLAAAIAAYFEGRGPSTSITVTAKNVTGLAFDEVYPSSA